MPAWSENLGVVETIGRAKRPFCVCLRYGGQTRQGRGSLGLSEAVAFEGEGQAVVLRYTKMRQVKHVKPGFA